MILVFTQKNTARFSYIFKHIFKRILGVDVTFTSSIESFLAHEGHKLSYGKKPLGNELFFQAYGLLEQSGIESLDIKVKEWGETKYFFAVSEKSALPFDIFSATFYLLSRYEEYLPHVKDSSGRYPANQSLAYKNNFLQSPIVDVWSYKLKEVLKQFFPDLKFPKKLYNTHFIIDASVPYAYKQKGGLRSLMGFFNDATKGKFKNVVRRFQVKLRARKDPYDTFKWIIRASKTSTTKISVFFLLSEAKEYLDGVNYFKLTFKMLIKYIADYKEIGLSFSHKAMRDIQILKVEKQRLEEIINTPVVAATNPIQFVNLPHMYRNMVELELLEDYTMSYHNKLGFRAGTCTPFLFYDLDYEIRTPLLIHPVAVTTKAMRTQGNDEEYERVAFIKKNIVKVNGVFTVRFLNSDFNQEIHGNVLRSIFSENLQ